MRGFKKIPSAEKQSCSEIKFGIFSVRSGGQKPIVLTIELRGGPFDLWGGGRV